MKNIIFDWSGVIKDAIESHLWVVNKMFEKFGANKISLEELKENWEQPYMPFYNKYLPDLTIKEEQAAYKEIILNIDCPKSEAFSGIVDLIKRLKEKGNFLAVISSDLPETVFAEIKDYGLENIFDDVITNIYDKFEAIRGLINERELNPNEMFLIGDSNHEIEAGKRAGIKSIAVTWGFSTEQKLKSENPDFMVNDLEELEKIVL